MRHGSRILVVVPARGGSKGVPLKNLRPVDGVALVARTGHLVAELDWVDRAVVSTDHSETARTAREAGLDAPFYRPAEISGDRIGDLDVLTHALTAMEELDSLVYDVVVMLQPTSPLRRAEHVTETVDRLCEGGFDSVWTVSPSDAKLHPLKQLRLDEGRLALWDPTGAQIIARQQLPPVYHRNGAAYACTRSCLLDQRTLLGERASAVVIDEPMVSIDTLDDFQKVEAILAERRANLRDAGSGDTAPQRAGAVGAAVAPPPGPRRFVIDIDGVLASLVPGNDYRRATPLVANIARVNTLFDQGHRIVLFTARGSETGKDWSDLTARQMKTWGVRYHELRFGKPAADYYVDDRLIGLEEAVQIAGGATPPEATLESKPDGTR